MGFGKYRDGMSSMLVSRLLIVGAKSLSVIENRNIFVVVGFFFNFRSLHMLMGT